MQQRATPVEQRVRSVDHLGDFTLDLRVLVIILVALPVGAASALAAWCLLKLIGLITNVVFYQRVETSLVAPGGAHHSPWLILFAPVVGGLVVGVMARFGSEKIRGHGMPEAIEAILTGGSRIEPKVAVYKPISSAVSIGTGGPFGAEGPIIMTGGAVGSILAQVLKLTADERKTLLVAGAAGGMAATFNSPLASVLLAVELLLFEWRPRSFVPVVAAVCVATLVRGPLLGTGPIFPVDTHGAHITAAATGLAVVIGIAGGVLAVGATALVYLAEDGFNRLPVHWMWWPAIGGLIIGIGGLIEPRALGVGYDVIDDLLTGRATLSLIIGILVVKTLIWSLSLGSGTSGGVLAPVFMIGGSLGALIGLAFPQVYPGFWALLGLAAVVGGVMRSPLTGVVFSLELTHAWSTVLPLLVASTIAYLVSTLWLKRSVLTEKIARHGLHLTREYSIDPLEGFFASQVMCANPITFAVGDGIRAIRQRLADEQKPVRGTPLQRLYPVLAEDGTLAGVVTLGDMMHTDPESAVTAGELMDTAAIVVYGNDTVRHVANVFAESGRTRAPVVLRSSPGELLGVVSLEDLLHARLYDLTEERHRERQLLTRTHIIASG